MSDPSVRIRMYRPGLGDCFLLTFKQGANESHILIDCGRFDGSKFTGIDWPDIMADIKSEVGPSGLNAVVVTHEHSDHISGFHANLEEFRKLASGELWLAWTEDPAQTIATEKKGIHALRETGKQLMRSADTGVREIGESVLEVLKFSPETDKQFEEIKALWPKNRTKLFDPGKVLERDWLPGVRVYVLGPPQNKKMLNKKEGTLGVEMYKLAGFGAMSGAAISSDGTGMMPFDSSYRWPRDQPGKPDPLVAVLESYTAEDWRNVDQEWLETAQRLALQYDNSVNNTSLVLAFELIESGKVLLFVGDAQIGNWLSWQTLEFSLPGGVKVKPAELLRRVVFYKCGHHGSHNATLKKGGLEAMPEGIHVAVPTNQAFAEKRKPHAWHMPSEGVAEAFKARHCKVVRADDAVTDAFIDVTI